MCYSWIRIWLLCTFCSHTIWVKWKGSFFMHPDRFDGTIYATIMQDTPSLDEISVIYTFSYHIHNVMQFLRLVHRKVLWLKYLDVSYVKRMFNRKFIWKFCVKCELTYVRVLERCVLHFRSACVLLIFKLFLVYSLCRKWNIFAQWTE